MAKKKLMPSNPGARKVSAGSLKKASGTNKPMAGGGSRGTGKPKLMPSNKTEQRWSAGGLRSAKGKNRPMDGSRD